MINVDIRSSTDGLHRMRVEVGVKKLSFILSEKSVYNLVEEWCCHQTSRFGGVVNTLPCYRPGNPFGGVGSNPAGDDSFFAFFPEGYQPFFSILQPIM